MTSLRIPTLCLMLISLVVATGCFETLAQRGDQTGAACEVAASDPCASAALECRPVTPEGVETTDGTGLCLPAEWYEGGDGDGDGDDDAGVTDAGTSDGGVDDAGVPNECNDVTASTIFDLDLVGACWAERKIFTLDANALDANLYQPLRVSLTPTRVGLAWPDLNPEAVTFLARDLDNDLVIVPHDYEWSAVAGGPHEYWVSLPRVEAGTPGQTLWLAFGWQGEGPEPQNVDNIWGGYNFVHHMSASDGPESTGNEEAGILPFAMSEASVVESSPRIAGPPQMGPAATTGTSFTVDSADSMTPDGTIELVFIPNGAEPLADGNTVMTLHGLELSVGAANNAGNYVFKLCAGPNACDREFYALGPNSSMSAIHVTLEYRYSEDLAQWWVYVDGEDAIFEVVDDSEIPAGSVTVTALAHPFSEGIHVDLNAANIFDVDELRVRPADYSIEESGANALIYNDEFISY